MSNVYCTDCVNHEDTFDENGAVDYCLYKDRQLSYIELEISRNVPHNAYGYCEGFIPEEPIAL